MTNPLVSIIIPTYNRAYLIGDTLKSIISQTYSNWECIIIDDGSTDNTENIINEFADKDKRFKYFHRPDFKPKGANACRNFGFELSKGEYINWFDDDDMMDQNKLKTQVESLENSDFNFSVCQTLVFQESIDNIIGFRHKKIISEDTFHDYVTQNIVWLTPSSLWKRIFLLNLNDLFDESLQAAQEWEFHCRVLLKSPLYHVENNALVYVRKHANSITYNSNNSVRIWNYFKARLLLYQNLTCSAKSKEYLRIYLLQYFKKMVRSNQVKKSFIAFTSFIIKESNSNLVINIFFYLASTVSFFVFKRGDFLLNKINISK